MKNVEHYEVCMLVNREDIYATWCGNDKNEGPLPLAVEDALQACNELEPEEFTVCVECADAVKRMLS